MRIGGLGSEAASEEGDALGSPKRDALLPISQLETDYQTRKK